MLPKRLLGLKLFLHSIALALFVTGCAAATGPDDTGGGETPEARGEDPASQTTVMFAGSEPPGSTLSHGGETVDGGLGGYCWSGGGGGSCVDAVGISLEDGTLEAPTGATLSFDYAGKDLTSLDVAAYRADREGEGGGREDDVFVMPSGGRGREISRSAAPGPGRGSPPTCPPGNTCSTPASGCQGATPPTASG